MTASNEHVTPEEVLRLLHAHARGHKEDHQSKLEEHLRHCQRCRQVVEEYQRAMSGLYQNRIDATTPGRCPDPGTWGELACGLIAQKEAAQYLEHAASCSSCVEELLYALDALGGNEGAPDELLQSLTTATADWQKRFAAKIAGGQTSVRAVSQPVPVPKRSSRPAFPLWAYAGLAAVATLAVGLGLYRWTQGTSSESLIREAYAQQRTVEMRLPGAGYGPVRVQRAANQSQISSPRALLEAEVLIKRGLEKRPDDAALLQQEAETDLLNWNYQPALETLNRASRLKPNSFELLVDTATAYFERAEATANPADYEAGLQLLSDAIRLRPDDAAALFNRAILYERLYFYNRAIADWEQFLKIEKNPDWRKEAEQRLNDLRDRLRKQGVRRDPDRLVAAEFQKELASVDPPDPEEYAEAAERSILPQIARAEPADENHQAASALANILESRHSDPFLKDLLLSSANPGFQRAAALLGQSSSFNHTGQYEQAYASALESASRFRKIRNTAGVLAAQFELLYALQFEGKAKPCVAEAARAADAARANRYALLEVQLLLEQAICSNMNGNLRDAKDLMLAALALAKSHGYTSFYVRGLTALADLDDQEGDEAGAWSAIQEGLALYWNRGLPPVRAYSLYEVLGSNAQRLGHYHVQFAAAYEAVNSGFANPDRNVEAWLRARLATAALRTGELRVAQAEFERASRIFSRAPNTGSVRWRELDARVGLARVQMLKGENLAESAQSLQAALPDVEALSNRYVESQYYETLAELKWRLQDIAASRQYLDRALRLAENGARSLPTWRERSAWMEQHRDTYALVTQVLLSTGHPQSALDLWEQFRSADPIQLPSAATTTLRTTSPVIPDRPRAEPAVLTYALLGPQLMVIWIRGENESHAVSLPEPRGLRQTAENFISESSRPDSDLASLQADAQQLYKWLIAPVSQWIPKQGHLIVEPDGIVNIVPFEILMDAEANYLGTRYSITVASSVRARTQVSGDEPLHGLTKALIVAAPAALSSSAEPPPDALREALRVAQDFNNPVLFTGNQATTQAVRQELSKSQIFHFAGHGMLGRNGAAMIMADGLLGIDQTRDFSSRHLDHLKLAVFSACDTAKGSERLQSEGLVSEFLHAGTVNVVASRWSVDSVATTDYMQVLYASVLSGNSVAESSRTAAQAIRKMPGRSHPYYWAAFSTFGRS